MLGPFATASRRTHLFYIAIHQVSLLSHAACASMSTTISTTTTTTRDRGDRYGPMEWAQSASAYRWLSNQGKSAIYWCRVSNVRSVYILQAGDYSVVEIESGVARCPYDPLHNSTALYVGQLSVV